MPRSIEMNQDVLVLIIYNTSIEIK